MTEREPFPTAAGVESAIKGAAKKAAAADPSLDVNKRIQLEYFNRFLSRVFSEGDGGNWVLKGGTGILARVPSTRATRDIDLYRQGFTLTKALDLPRLISHPYRLYPVVDQIADKVCATMTEYSERTSSREKDLVDLVIFAATQDIDGTALRIAITTEARRRQMAPSDRCTVPSSWGVGYTKLSKSVPYCIDYRTVEVAKALVTRLIDPALSGDADGKAWTHERLAWV